MVGDETIQNKPFQKRGVGGGFKGGYHHWVNPGEGGAWLY